MTLLDTFLPCPVLLASALWGNPMKNVKAKEVGSLPRFSVGTAQQPKNALQASPTPCPPASGESTTLADEQQTVNQTMVTTFQVHKQTYGHWPAKNGKPAGESFDLDLIDMSLPAEHSYRGVLPYRLAPDEKDKFWGKVERKHVQVAIHEIQHSPRGPVLRGAIISVNEK